MEKSQPHLMAQDAATVDPTKLTALTPEVVSVLLFVSWEVFSRDLFWIFHIAGPM